MRALKLIRLPLVALLLFIGFLALRGCFMDNTSTPVADVPNLKPLPPEDKLRVTVNDNYILVQDKDKLTRRYLSNDGAASITVKKDDRVEIRVKQAGTSFQPGLGVIGSDRLRLTLDTKLFYWNRLGLVTGIGFAVKAPLAIGYVGLSYNLDQVKLKNTAAVIGYTTKGDIAIGLRVAF